MMERLKLKLSFGGDNIMLTLTQRIWVSRMCEENSSVKEAFERVRKPSSYYWAFWTPEGLDFNRTYAVEIRLNLPDGAETEIDGIAGWTIAHRKSGMLFLRREQLINKKSVEKLFWDALTIAVEHGWQFHSWKHYPDLPDWSASLR